MNSCTSILVIQLLLLLISNSARSQSNPALWDEEFIVKIFGRDEGLETTGITDITLSPHGLFYLSTFDGIYRFDGTSFINASANEFALLPESRIIGIKARPDTSFLIKTEYGNSFAIKQKQLVILDSLSIDNQPLEFVENDDSGRYLYDRNVIYRFSNSLELKPILSSQFGVIRSCLVDSAGNFWFHTPMGIVYTLKNEQHLVPNNYLPFDFQSYPNGDRQLNFTSVKQGVAVVGYKGVAVLNYSGEFIFTKTFERNIVPSNILPFEEESLLVTSLNGFGIIDLATQSYSERSPFSNFRVKPLEYPTLWHGKPLVISFNHVLWGNRILYQNDEPQQIWKVIAHPVTNDIWIITRTNGLVKISKSSFKTFDKKDGLSGENIYGIDKYNSSLFLASFDKGLMYVNNEKVVTIGPEIVFARSVAFLPRSNAIISGHWGGASFSTYLPSVKPVQGTLIPSDNLFTYSDNNSMDFIKVFSDSTVVLGDHSRLGFTDSSFSHFEEITTESGNSTPGVRSWLTINSNSHLVGTRKNGLFLISNLRSYPISSSKHDLPLSIRDITFTSNKNQYWLATEGKGLACITLEGLSVKSISYISINEGLPVSSFHRIIRDSKNQLWVSSNNGLFQFDEDNLLQFIEGGNTEIGYRKFDINHGLPTNEFNGGVSSAGIKLDSSFILLPSVRGLVAFDPNIISSTTFSERLFVERIVTTSGADYFPSNEINLESFEREIELKIGSNQIIQPSPNPILYRNSSNKKGGWNKLGDQKLLNLASLKPGKNEFQFKISHSLKDEAILIVHLNVDRVFYEMPQFQAFVVFLIVGLFLTGFNIQKRANLKRERILEDKVLQRTKELRATKEQVEKQSVTLKTLARYKEDLFAALTHEIKTPLSLLVGPLQVIKDSLEKGKGADTTKMISLMDHNVNKLMSLVGRILTTIQYSSETEALSLGEIRTSNLANYLQDEITKQFLPFVHRISFTSDSHNATLITDKTALALAVSNLVSNALKYSEKDVIVRFSHSESSFDISVRDFGKGIPPSEQESIFQPYFSSNLENNEFGSGIGLTITKRLTELMNGKMSLFSEVAKGSTFTLSFDRIESKSNSNAVALNENTVESPISDKSEKQIRLLYIDDNPDFYTLLEQAFGGKFSLSYTSSALNALNLVKSNIYDVILCDVMMPEMSGFEFAKNLRELPNVVSSGLIFISANDSVHAVEKGFSLGAEAFLRKPIDLKNLETHIISIVGRNKEISRLKTTTKSSIRKSVEEIILINLSDSELSIEFVATKLSMSKSALYRKWKENESISINDLIARIRIREVFNLVYTQECSFNQASMSCGFKYNAYFSRVFKKYFHQTPSDYMERYPRKIPLVDD